MLLSKMQELNSKKYLNQKEFKDLELKSQPKRELINKLKYNIIKVMLIYFLVQ